MTIELDHIGISVSDFDAARKFYAAALAPLRIGVIMEFPASVTGNFAVAGLGADGKPFLWISGEGRTVPHAHVAIRAESREQVDAFYAAAMAAGGRDNGPPGLRPHYHQNYYGAFVFDTDGHNIEAVCHASAEEIAAANRPATKRAAPKKRASAKKPARRATATGKPARRAAAKKAPARKASAKKPAGRRKPAARRGKGRR